MRRAAAPVLVTLLVVLAGCIGGGATGDDPTTSATTTEQPADGSDESPYDGSDDGTNTRTEDGSSVDESERPSGNWTHAPGISDSGASNLSTLLSAHAARLTADGFELRSGYEVSGSGADEYDEYALTRETLAAAGLDGTRSTVVRERDGQRLAGAQWLNASMQLARNDVDGEVTYQGNRVPASAEIGPAFGRQYADVHRVESVLRSAELSVERVEETADETRVHLESTAFGLAVREDGEYIDGEVSLEVDGNGVIRSLEASGTERDGGTFAFEYRVDRLGVDSVDRPAWLADAPPLVDPELDFEFENCTTPYLVLDHRGGDALPAGSTLSVEAQGDTQEVVLDSELDEGTRYLSLDTDGTLRITTDAPAADERSSIGTDVSISVVSDGGYTVLNAGMGFGCASESGGDSAGSDDSSSSGSSGDSSGGGSDSSTGTGS